MFSKKLDIDEMESRIRALEVENLKRLTPKVGQKIKVSNLQNSPEMLVTGLDFEPRGCTFIFCEYFDLQGVLRRVEFRSPDNLVVVE